ncbi:hypothetical protein ACLGIH_33225 [Streptomyces sp. HMX87]|uniref:hypothetical protein n=1 Tax=Streptomyces sp. HMX87 TaxID=3390849 RepID=UPI003A83AC34
MASASPEDSLMKAAMACRTVGTMLGDGTVFGQACRGRTGARGGEPFAVAADLAAAAGGGFGTSAGAGRPFHGAAATTGFRAAPRQAAT